MKLAAAEALAGLVAEPTAENIIPWSLDPAVVPAVSHAVARAWQSEQGRYEAIRTSQKCLLN